MARTMNRILDRLWLGDFADGQHATAPITCILNLHREYYDSPLRTIWAPLTDEMVLPPEEWQSLVHVLYAQLSHGATVLVQCRLGKSRAPALVVAYLASCGWELQQALTFVKQRREQVDVHPETWRGVETWWASRKSPRG